MAYMHKETFDIVVENSCKNPNDYFYVDELIELPVQILNRKGYITEFCCAGHPFDYLEENGEFERESEDARAKRLARKTYRSLKGYISFKECISKWYGIPFTAITDTGRTFTLADPKIYDNDVYKFMRDVTESMEQLYEWALKLPDFKNE